MKPEEAVPRAAKELYRAARRLNLYLETASEIDQDAVLNLMWDVEAVIERLKNLLAFPPFLITSELAEKCGVNSSRIRQVAPALEKDGLAMKESGIWRFLPAAVDAVKSMPGPGRPRAQK